MEVAGERRELDPLPVRSDALNLDGKAFGELPPPELDGLGQMRHALGDGRDADDATAITPWIPEALARCVEEQRRAHLRTDAPRAEDTAKRAVVRNQASGSRSEISSSAAVTSLVCQLAETCTIGWQEQPLRRSAERESDRPRVAGVSTL